MLLLRFVKKFGCVGAVGVSWTRPDALEVKRVSSDKDAHGFGGHAVFEVTFLFR